MNYNQAKATVLAELRRNGVSPNDVKPSQLEACIQAVIDEASHGSAYTNIKWFPSSMIRWAYMGLLKTLTALIKLATSK